MDKIEKIAEKKLQEMYLPLRTQEWVDALKTLNVAKVKKLLKKTRDSLPKKYARLYLASDDKILILAHYMRTQYPFFTEQEKVLSQRFIDMNNAVANGEKPWEFKIH